MSAVPGYRLFNVTLLHKTQLTPSLMRCVFGGEQVERMKMDGPDQRIKILFPSLNGTPSALTAHNGWWDQLKSLAPEQRPIPRTYTVRKVNSADLYMDVEFVLHGTEGPASRWAITAAPGDALQIVAPNGEHTGDSGGYEWKPHPGVERALIIADETALPAVKGILAHMATLPSPPTLQIFQEIPLAGDYVDFSKYAFADVYWLPRDRTQTPHGTALLEAVKQHAVLPAYALDAQYNDADEVDEESLWCAANDNSNRFYGWVAAESTTVKHLRRYLIGERNVANALVSFMAYWSKGRA